MKTLTIVRHTFAVATALVAGLSGCAVGNEADEAPASSEAALRTMTPEEVLGEIHYGETIDVDVTPAPKYRAYWFRGEKNDQVQVQVVTRNGTDPVLWITDEAGTVISMNNDVRATDSNAQVVRFLPQAGKYLVVFREMNGSPRAKFSVAVRKLGRLPLDCDPDGEGIFLPECTEPFEVDPFDPTSCTGAQIAPGAATTTFPEGDGLRLSRSKIYYRTRQCQVLGSGSSATTTCSPWVRAHGMDVPLTNVKVAAAAAPTAPRSWSITADPARSIKVDFSLPAGVGAVSSKYCVDGPFTSLRAGAWTPTPEARTTICASNVPSVVTARCARFEPKSMIIDSGSPTYYTEFGSVLIARY